MGDPTTRGVRIVGVGARTPIGLRASLAAAAVRAGICRIAEHPTALDRATEPCMVAMDRSLKATERRERLCELVTAALDEALETVAVAATDRVPVFLALPEEGPFFSKADATFVATHVKRHLDARLDVTVDPMPQGNAAGLLGYRRATEALKGTKKALAIVAGVDSQIDEAFLTTLDSAGRLMSSANRWGYPPGEGAGAVVLSNVSLPGTTGDLAYLRSVGIAEERSLIATDSICIGAGLTAAFKEALATLRSPEETVSFVYCDINPERYRISEYLYAAMRVQQKLPEPTEYIAPVDCWGDTGAATIPLLTALAVAAGQRGYARGPLPMLWASSESGLRGAAVLELPSTTTRSAS
ncbi:MAG: hypothetical protein JNG84_13810 [Archangium sp.]|nr:hypothetical protein [Archangium sp.]